MIIFALILLLICTPLSVANAGEIDYGQAKSLHCQAVLDYQYNQNHRKTAVVKLKNAQVVKGLAVGDIMLGRYVESLMRSNGANYPFEKVNELLAGNDIVLGNLEGPISNQHAQTPNGSLSFSFSEDKATIIKDNFFTHVTLANNHTYDRGRLAFDHTRDVLEKSGVFAFGNPEEELAEYITRTKVRNQEFVFLGFRDMSTSFDREQALVLIESENSNDAFVIVSIHWGSEYVLHSGTQQQELAHDMIDAGADVIFGHHPHVVQEIEEYEGKIIFYSLGNFIFDQYFSQDTQQELAVEFNLSPDEIIYTLHPLQSVNSQPAEMTGDIASSWLARLADRSSETIRDSIKSGKIHQTR
ncbi:MAG: CapA family protein [bacterium]|nr:CapA family protein [bacterium]